MQPSLFSKSNTYGLFPLSQRDVAALLVSSASSQHHSNYLHIFTSYFRLMTPLRSSIIPEKTTVDTERQHCKRYPGCDEDPEFSSHGNSFRVRVERKKVHSIEGLSRL